MENHSYDMQINKIRIAQINDSLKKRLIKNWDTLSLGQKKRIMTLLTPASEKVAKFQMCLTTVVKKIQADIAKDAEKNESITTMHGL